MLDKAALESYISALCKNLDIVPPRMHYNSTDMQSKTTIAQAACSGEDIYLKKLEGQDERDVLFATTHEIRHIWQIRKHEEEFFKNYKPLNLCSDIDEYNLQDAELDANAYATAVMLVFFKGKPLFNSLDEATKDEIYRRASKIISNGEI